MGWPARLPSEVDAIVEAYLIRAGGSPGTALRMAVQDALADLWEAERRAGEQNRLISRGYARAGLNCRQ
ncbi:hypothetical protein HCU64_23760 [Methylobacterium sp. C25]|nr:hypothetical protein [Methylobacterium sp. C25]